MTKMQENNIKYWEVYYASSQEGALSQADGFGIRAYSDGLPTGILEELKAQNIFYYQSGNRSLPSSFELMDTPELVNDYPKTNYYNRVIIGDNTYFILSRTAFIGRDYGWYLDDVQENARSGNTFTHALIFDRYHPIILHSFLSPEVFLPKNLINTSNNLELKHLLTGPPPQLAEKTLDAAALHALPTEEVVPRGLFLTYLGLQEKLPTVVRTQYSIANIYLVNILDLLPNCIKKDHLAVKTNYQEFFFDPGTHLIFINEDFSNPVDPNSGSYVLDDLIQNINTEIPQSPFYTFLQNTSYHELKKFCAQADYMLEGWTDDIDLETIYLVFQFLFTGNHHHLAPHDLIKALVAIDDYPLSPAFRRERNQLIIEQFRSKIAGGDIKGTQLYLNLVNDLNIKEEYTTADHDKLNLFLLENNAFYQFLHDGYPLKSLLPYTNTNALLTNMEHIFTALKGNKPYFEQVIRYLMQHKHSERTNILYLTLKDEYCTPKFYESLYDLLGTDEYQSLLKDNLFFHSIGKEKHFKFLRGVMQQYIRNVVSSSPNELSLLIAALENIFSNEKATYFHSYSSYLTKYLLEGDFNFNQCLQLFNHLQFLAENKIEYWENEIYQKGLNAVKFLFNNLHYFTDPEIKNKLWDKLNTFSKTIETNKLSQFKQLLGSLPPLMDGIQLFKAPTILVRYGWESGYFSPDEFVRYIIRNTVPDFARFDQEQWKEALNNLFDHHNGPDAPFPDNVINFFYYESNQYLLEYQSKLEKDSIFEFNAAYFDGLYSLYLEAQDTDEQAIQDYIVENIIKPSLSILKDIDASLYRSLTRFFSKEKPDFYDLVKEKTLFAKIKNRIIQSRTSRNEAQKDGD